jgi:hypothetical protein
MPLLLPPKKCYFDNTPAQQRMLQLSACQLVAIREIPTQLLTTVIFPILTVRREARLRLFDLDSAPSLDVMLWQELQKLPGMLIVVFGMTIHDFSQMLQHIRYHVRQSVPHQYTITELTAKRLVLREDDSGVERTVERKDMENSRGLDADLIVYTAHPHGECHPLPESICGGVST